MRGWQCIRTGRARSVVRGRRRRRGRGERGEELTERGISVQGGEGDIAGRRLRGCGPSGAPAVFERAAQRGDRGLLLSEEGETGGDLVLRLSLLGGAGGGLFRFAEGQQ